MLTEQDFRLEADRALEQAQHALLPLADEEGFEVELQNGVLQIVFEDPTVGNSSSARTHPSGKCGCRRCLGASSCPGPTTRGFSSWMANPSTPCSSAWRSSRSAA